MKRKRKAVFVCFCVSVWLHWAPVENVPSKCNSIRFRDAEREERSIFQELHPELNVSVAT